MLKDMFLNGMNVLSLFSRIGGAAAALHRLGIRLNNVVSVEISEVNRNIVRSWWEQTNQRENLIDFDNLQQLRELAGAFAGGDIGAATTGVVGAAAGADAGVTGTAVGGAKAGAVAGAGNILYHQKLQSVIFYTIRSSSQYWYLQRMREIHTNTQSRPISDQPYAGLFMVVSQERPWHTSTRPGQ
ncbi:hypothetical protein P3L10_028533 [Capsicum annuum]